MLGVPLATNRRPVTHMQLDGSRATAAIGKGVATNKKTGSRARCRSIRYHNSGPLRLLWGVCGQAAFERRFAYPVRSFM